MSLIPSGELKVVYGHTRKNRTSHSINESNSLRGVESCHDSRDVVALAIVSMSLIPSGELKVSNGSIPQAPAFVVSMSLIPSGELKAQHYWFPRPYTFAGINESNSLRGVESGRP